MKINVKKVSAVILAVLPLLVIYKINFIFNGLAEFFCVLVLLLFIISGYGKKNKDGEKSKKYILCNFIFLAVLCISSVLNIDINLNYRQIIFMIIIMLILYGADRECIDFKVFRKIYTIIAVLSTIYLLIQIICIKAFNMYLPANILPLETGNMFNYQAEYARLGVLRGQSFFSEPSVYAQYIIPIYCIILFKEKLSKKDIGYLVLFTIGMIFSTSSMGIIAIAIALVLYLYKYSKINFIKFLFIGIFVMITSLIIINSNEYIKSSLDSIFFSADSSGKLTTRFYRGFAVYEEIPFLNKMIGTGVGNGDYFINKYSIVTDYESEWGNETEEYFNNMASSLIYGGIFAGVIFLYVQLVFVKSNKYDAKALAIIYFMICFCSSSFFNVTYLFFGLNLLSIDKYYKKGE